jgi:hypothetical protein
MKKPATRWILPLALMLAATVIALPRGSSADDILKPQQTGLPTSAPADSADEGIPDAAEFNSKLALQVWFCDEQGVKPLGKTPAADPLIVPKCRWWAIQPLAGVSVADAVAEGKAGGVRGLKLDEASDDDLAQLSGWPTLQAIDLSWTKITDVGLAHLKDLKGLQSLYLDGTKITDAGLAHLKDLKGLQTLYLNGTKITDAGLVHLKDLKGLQTLYLGGAQITDAGLAQLKELKGLQILYVGRTQITDAGLRDLRKALPNTQVSY